MQLDSHTLYYTNCHTLKFNTLQELIKVISTGVDVNTLDKMTGTAPIHAIVMDRKRKDKPDLLLALLVYSSRVDVNLQANNWKKMTALQLAIEVCMGKLKLIIFSDLLTVIVQVCMTCLLATGSVVVVIKFIDHP